MFIEGYINREFLRILTEAGFDVIWKCETPNDLIKYGWITATEKDGIDLTKETVVRIFISSDMEDYLMPILIADMGAYGTPPSEKSRQSGLRKKLLPLMAVCGNERMKNYAIHELERG
jgi:hypothetical protein